MKDAKRNMNHNMLLFLGVLILGIFSVFVGHVLNWETQVMNGIAFGTIPTGILGTILSIWAARWTNRKHPDWQLKERDERNAYINHRAGHTAFWALFLCFSIYTLLSPTQLIRGVSYTVFGSSTIIFMSLVYFIAVYIYSRIY